MAEGATSASRIASAAASAKSSELVRSCLPNLVMPTPMTATRRIDPPTLGNDVSLHHDTRARGESSATGRAPPPRGTVRTHEGSGDGVTLEEGLIALLAAVAGILLFVGLAQALDARRPRRRRRRVVPRPEASATTSAPSTLMVAELAAPRIPYTGPERRSLRPGSRARARAAPSVASPPPVETPAPGPAAVSEPMEELSPVHVSVGAAPPVHASTPAPSPSTALSQSSDPVVTAVERILALQSEGQHAEVLGAAAHLELSPASEMYETSSFSRAALRALVGVSRHALGDVEGTQEVVEAAVREAPDGVAEGCPERIAAVAGAAARQLLAAADRMSAASAERVAFLRMAVLWLEWRRAASSAPEEISALLDKARESLWEGYVLAGRGLLQRRQFAAARSLVRQALESEDLPASRRAPLTALAAQGVVRQIGRLVATARGTATPEADALDALERAREILAATSAESIAPRRWHASNQRIWNGYMRLARRQIESFELEAAVRPLLRALHLRDLELGLERRTRDLLARTIERIADRAGETIGRLLKTGDRDAAMQRWQDVRGLIQKARDQGMSHEELAQAFNRARQMLEQIEAVKR